MLEKMISIMIFSMINMDNLILDVKILIASYDENVWIKLTSLDDEFYQYAYTINGINLFVNQFTERKDNDTYLFNKLHSINDLPAKLNANGDKFWFCSGQFHRKNDLPAIICANGDKFWCCSGQFHRENDLPAIIHASGDRLWYYDGKRHRENDLPAVIYDNGSKYWYYDGKIHRKNNMHTFIKG